MCFAVVCCGLLYSFLFSFASLFHVANFLLFSVTRYQRSGYGKFIISLSYEISKRSKKAGSPEKPLSDLGKLSYRSYWTHVLFTVFSTNEKSISIEDIVSLTAIRSEDVISTLQHNDMILEWKGQHVIAVNRAKVNKYLKEHSKPVKLCKQEYLNWQPKEDK